MKDQAWVDALSSIDANFYERYGASFDGTRREPWQGWGQILEHLVSSPARDPLVQRSILDLGCGNGRFLSSLIERPSFDFEYRGIDRSETLLDLARSRCQPPSDQHRFCFVNCDLLDTAALADALDSCHFDWIVVFGVMHHVPSAHRRAAILRLALASLERGGRLAVSFWRFDHSPRLIERAQPLFSISEGGSAGARLPSELRGLAEQHAEQGDYLLPWGNSGAADALRFCHCFSDGEIDHLIGDLTTKGKSTDYSLVEDFPADGKSGDLNRYLVFERR